MKTKFKISLLMVVIIGRCFFSPAFGQISQEKFIYDSEGRRDPFIPLLEKDSATGLRTIFTPPDVRVKLPVEIVVKGILWSGQEYFAIINDEVMKKGDNLGEVKIKKIEQDRVILEYGQREYPAFLRKKEKER